MHHHRLVGDVNLIEAYANHIPVWRSMLVSSPPSR